ncbi:hypothetical protein RND81_09G015300 [Saponaria officinalis]|uniref:F-box domain-containing protein n=1 Tax=Saponaria officinalis TaxID=3572 RepID=A0AAW1IHL2_SAPOF
METNSILHVDVLEEILMRLPVKDLLRWKVVSKQWYALIRACIFNKKHYKFKHAMYITNCNDVPLFLDVPSTEDKHQTQFYLLSKQGDDNVVLDITRDFERDIPPKLANDLELRNMRVKCMGIVNGVVGLQWGRHRLALWNPATREFKDVARWPITSDYNEDVDLYGSQILGLGFDLKSNNFEILGLIDYHQESSIYDFHLYSLKTDSWTRLKEAPTSMVNFQFSDNDAYLENGIYYWLASGRSHLSDNMIISFNFSTKMFKETILPKGFLCRNDGNVKCVPWKYLLGIGKYKQGLGLFINRTVENNGGIEIWAVTKYEGDDEGVPLCWELVVRVAEIQCYDGLYISTIRVCGDLLLIIQDENSDEEVFGTLYDPRTNTFNNIGAGFCTSFTYVESLFSLSKMLF